MNPFLRGLLYEEYQREAEKRDPPGLSLEDFARVIDWFNGWRCAQQAAEDSKETP